MGLSMVHSLLPVVPSDSLSNELHSTLPCHTARHTDTLSSLFSNAWIVLQDVRHLSSLFSNALIVLQDVRHLSSLFSNTWSFFRMCLWSREQPYLDGGEASVREAGRVAKDDPAVVGVLLPALHRHGQSQHVVDSYPQLRGTDRHTHTVEKGQIFFWPFWYRQRGLERDRRAGRERDEDIQEIAQARIKPRPLRSGFSLNGTRTTLWAILNQLVSLMIRWSYPVKLKSTLRLSIQLPSDPQLISKSSCRMREYVKWFHWCWTVLK